MRNTNTLSKVQPETDMSSLQNEYGYRVSIERFTGPMDLLLHLVHQREVAVEEVEMAEIAQQYLQIILSQSNALDLETAGEYLVIASTLIAIKSEALLPPISPEGIEDMPEGMSLEFYEQLRARLKQYELAKMRGLELRARPILGIDTFVRRAGSLDDGLDTEEALFEGAGDAHSLGIYFTSLLKRIGEGTRRFFVAVEPVSIVQLMVKTIDSLARAFEAGAQRSSFHHLVGDFFKEERAKKIHSATAPSSPRTLVIGTFVALLELVKRGAVRVFQEEESAEILVESALLSRSSAETTDLRDGKLHEERIDEFWDGQEVEVGDDIESKVISISEYTERAKRKRGESDTASVMESSGEAKVENA